MNRRARSWLIFGLLLLMIAAFTAYELIASPLQAMFLSDYASRLTFHDGIGPSDSIRFPSAGPSDVRLGYTALPEYIGRLEKRGYTIVKQARISSEMANLDKFGLFLPYREKTVAGLTLDDCADDTYYRFTQPRRYYPDFDAIPPMVANTLLFIENRELLDPNHPQRNPAVEWDRLGEAVLEKMVQTVQPGHHVPGGSTLATQIEKYRHSPGGLTMTAGDKLRQMASASFRAYLDGPDTRVTRRRLVLDYLNTVPLSAAPGFGEVNGLGDGLQAWFGLDFDEANRLLAQPKADVETARAYKYVLALLISQRKPSWFLVKGRAQLEKLVNTHLGLLAQTGIISPALRDLARKQHLHFRDKRKDVQDNVFVRQKAVAATRNRLAAMLGVDRMYDLDRLDLTVHTTLDAPTQQAVTEFLTRLSDPAVARAGNLYGYHLLSPGNDLSKILYSFTLYQRTLDGPVLRVQADNLNQPFDINQGAKLGMGSTAKLRTLATYLGIIAELHDRYDSLNRKALDRVKVPKGDVLEQWAVDYLRATPDRDLTAMLRAAMARRYSASVTEGFYTGGGLHYFANFKKSEDSEVMDLWEAFRRSVNLPFVRLMRDIVHHIMYGSSEGARQILENGDDPRRLYYLRRFADREGTTYLIQFHKKYRGLDRRQVTARFFDGIRPTPRRLAAILRYLEPDADLATFSAGMKARLPKGQATQNYDALYQAYGPDKFNLADRAYIARVHPLELWLVGYLLKHPDAHWDEIALASTQARQDSYQWLFKTSRKSAQDIRIRTQLETEAFKEIHRRWARLGYPFASVVPSYATAIGSSADRPAALAELMGIILNNGRQRRPVTLRRLDFASGTPYHTVLAKNPSAPQQLMPAPVARVLSEALAAVVADGTAKRVNGAFADQAGPIVIGGKTGTGDNRFETFAANGAVLKSRAVNRVATFAFYIGRHFYGVITAYVPGGAADAYRFSSALPVQILRNMAPLLQPLVAAGESRALNWDEEVEAFDAANPEPAPKAGAPSVPATPPVTATQTTADQEAKPVESATQTHQAAPPEAAQPAPIKMPTHDVARPAVAPKAPRGSPWLPAISPQGKPFLDPTAPIPPLNETAPLDPKPEDGFNFID